MGYYLKNAPKTFFLPNWRNFAQSGHTGPCKKTTRAADQGPIFKKNFAEKFSEKIGVFDSKQS
jgi:hypothetical protein